MSMLCCDLSCRAVSRTASGATWRTSGVVTGASMAGRSEVLGDDGMAVAGDPGLQLHDRVDDGLGPRRAAGHVHVHGDDLVDARDRGVVLVEAAAGGAR